MIFDDVEDVDDVDDFDDVDGLDDVEDVDDALVLLLIWWVLSDKVGWIDDLDDIDDSTARDSLFKKISGFGEQWQRQRKIML